MAQYYYVDSQGKQCGPFEKEILKQVGITPSTLVFTEGMSAWTPASQVPDLASIFVPGPNPVCPSSYMWLGILSTLLCCLPLGIVSIVYASKVNTLWLSGHYEEAKKASDKAQDWGIASVLVGIVFGIILFTVRSSNGY